jgi:S-(hydroxymethyl)glutathione dehydrogenase/alcohol dehydrogenase
VSEAVHDWGGVDMIVVTALDPITQTESSVNLSELAMSQKKIKGTILGSFNPRADISNLLSMYQEGTLKLDELITKTYPLAEINDGYEAMRADENIRGVIAHA